MVHVDNDATTVLFRPVGPKELALIRDSNYSQFPPRLEGQPYFYPVLNEEYAAQIAREWNARDPNIGEGFVTRFSRTHGVSFAVRGVYGRKFNPQGILDTRGGTSRVQSQHRRED
jgi:hypothetical protein